MVKVKHSTWTLMCDVCSRKETTQTYLITLPKGAAKSIELCDEHAQPIIDLAGRAKPARRTAKRKVASLEEIEAARIRDR